MKGSTLLIPKIQLDNWTAHRSPHQPDAPTIKCTTVLVSCSGPSVMKPRILRCVAAVTAAGSALVWGVYHLQGRATASLQNPTLQCYDTLPQEEGGGTAARLFLSGNHVRIGDTCSHSSCWTTTAHCCGVYITPLLLNINNKQRPNAALCCWEIDSDCLMTSTGKEVWLRKK